MTTSQRGLPRRSPSHVHHGKALGVRCSALSTFFVGVGHRLGSGAVSWCNHGPNLRNVLLRLSFCRIRLQILVSKADSDIRKQVLAELIDNIFAITYTIQWMIASWKIQAPVPDGPWRPWIQLRIIIYVPEASCTSIWLTARL